MNESRRKFQTFRIKQDGPEESKHGEGKEAGTERSNMVDMVKDIFEGKVL